MLWTVQWTVWRPSCLLCCLHGSKTFDESTKVCHPNSLGFFGGGFAYRCISPTSHINLLDYHRSPFPKTHTKAVLGSVKSIHSKFVKWIIGGLGHKCSTHVPNFFWAGAWKTGQSKLASSVTEIIPVCSSLALRCWLADTRNTCGSPSPNQISILPYFSSLFSLLAMIPTPWFILQLSAKVHPRRGRNAQGLSPT